jgi:hypothetical protein
MKMRRIMVVEIQRNRYAKKTACALYSLIETAKANNLNPYIYLKIVFEKVPTLTPDDDWGQLLPWNIDH